MNKLVLLGAVGLVFILGYMFVGGDSSVLYPAGDTGDASTVFTLTDAPGDYEELNLEVSEMKLYRDEGEISVPVDMEVDLTELQDVKMVLAEADVPEDQYQKITMKLERVRTRTQAGEEKELDLPADEITVAEDALLEDGNNSVEVDIPVESAVENDSFAPEVQTQVRGNVSFTTPEGMQVDVVPGESVEIHGGHGNVDVSVDVGGQGQQQVESEVSEQAQERVNKMMEKKGAQGNVPGDVGGLN